MNDTLKYMSDDELMEEIKKRLSEDKAAIANQKTMMKQLQELNRQLKESEKSKSNFISNIRNEIINPFTGILELASSIMYMGPSEIERVHSMAKMIHSAANDLDFQLKNIFEAAAIEAGESIAVPASVDVKALIEELIKAQRYHIAQKDIHVDLYFKSETGQECFPTDPEKLSLIVLNLLSNAIKFNHDGKAIGIRVIILESSLVVVVEDEGIGIKKTDLGDVFKRFTQLGVSSSGGHGLGLSVTKSLVESLGGTLLFCNKSPEGSIFTVTLPAMGSTEDLTGYSPNGNEIFFSPQTKF